jgi:hypothetical protein
MEGKRVCVKVTGWKLWKGVDSGTLIFLLGSVEGSADYLPAGNQRMPVRYPRRMST